MNALSNPELSEIQKSPLPRATRFGPLARAGRRLASLHGLNTREVRKRWGGSALYQAASD